MLLNGIVFAIGAWWSTGLLPIWVNYAFLPLLAGCSFASSLLAGIYFFDIYTNAKLLKRKLRTTFFQRNRMLLLFGVEASVLMDVLSMVFFVLYVNNASTIISGIFLLAQLIVGLVYIYTTRMFLGSTISRLAQMRQSKSSLRLSDSNQLFRERLARLAKLLMLSGTAMLVYCIFYIILAISGSVLSGAFSPSGWCCVWGGMISVRWAISFLQILMVTPKKSTNGINAETSTNSIATSSSSQVESSGIVSAPSMVSSEIRQHESERSFTEKNEVVL